MLDPLDQLLELGPSASVEQYLASSLKGGVAHLDDAVLRHRGEEADIDGVAHMHVIGEAAGEIQPGHVLGIDSELPHDNVLATVVGRLGLGEIADILLGKSDAGLGHYVDLEEFLVFGEDALGRQAVTAPQFGKQVDQTRTADPLGIRVANGGVGELPVP